MQSDAHDNDANKWHSYGVSSELLVWVQTIPNLLTVENDDIILINIYFFFRKLHIGISRWALHYGFICQ